MVFDYFVFHNAHSGIFHRHFGQRNPRFVGSSGSGLENGVYLLLRKGCKFFLRPFDPDNQIFQCLGGVNDFDWLIRHGFLILVSLIHCYLPFGFIGAG